MGLLVTTKDSAEIEPEPESQWMCYGDAYADYAGGKGNCRCNNKDRVYPRCEEVPNPKCQECRKNNGDCVFTGGQVYCICKNGGSYPGCNLKEEETAGWNANWE